MKAKRTPMAEARAHDGMIESRLFREIRRWMRRMVTLRRRARAAGVLLKGCLHIDEVMHAVLV